jgi:uncharacterized protein YndB with AHSA1/START domain
MISEKTPPAQTDRIAFDVELRHPPAKVWRAITDPVLLAEWLLPVVKGQLGPGQSFVLQAPTFPGWDGTVHCTVLEHDAPRRLRYGWVVGDMALDTVVTFVLEETPTGTRLSIEQSGFKPSQTQNFGGARYGWKMMGGRLEALLDRS